MANSFGTKLAIAAALVVTVLAGLALTQAPAPSRNTDVLSSNNEQHPNSSNTSKYVRWSKIHVVLSGNFDP